MENYSATNSKDSYPLEVEYCGSCGLPCDLCIYFDNYAFCLDWLKMKHPDRYKKLLAESLKNLQQQTTPSTINLKVNEDNQYVGITEKYEKDGKLFTKISGLSSFGVNLENALEIFKAIFRCATYLDGVDIVVEGAHKKVLYNILTEKWDIDPFDIEDLDDMNRI